MNNISNPQITISTDKLKLILQSLEEMDVEAISSTDFNNTSRYLLRQLLGSIPINQGSIYAYSETSRALVLHTYTGQKPEIETIPLSSEDITFFIQNPILRIIDSSNPFPLEEFEHVYGKASISTRVNLWIPLTAKSEFLGILFLGKKLTGTLQDEDIYLIQLLSRPIALAFYNHKILQEIRRTNFLLKQKVLELENLYDIAVAITSLHQADEISDEVLLRATTILDSRYGMLLTKKEGRYPYKVEKIIGFPWVAAQIPESIKAFLKELNKKWSDKQHLFDTQDVYVGDKLLATPLRTSRGILGILCVAHKETRECIIDYSDYDQLLLQSFASLVAVAIENARLHKSELEKQKLNKEMELAAEIQRNILPLQIPNHPNYEIITKYIPCQMVGGDYYNFIEIHNQLFGCCIADVTGKGVPAALLVSLLHASFQLLNHLLENPIMLVQRINQLMVDSSAPNKYITLFYALIDFSTNCCISLNAGHNYPMIISANGEIRELTEGGICLGVLPEFNYRTEQHSIETGDTILLFTDGVTELRNNKAEEFGVERLAAIGKQSSHKPLIYMRDLIIDELYHFATSESFSDDVTLILIRRNK